MTRMPRLFIIEGPDCTGKTSLATWMANRLNAVYMHTTSTMTLQYGMEDYLNNTLDDAKVCLENSGLDVILDRHWPSESIYGSVLRGGTTVDLRKIQDKIDAMNGSYIICIDEHAPGRHESQLDPKHPYDGETYLKVYNKYVELANLLLETRENVYFYNVLASGSNLEEFLQMIL